MATITYKQTKTHSNSSPVTWTVRTEVLTAEGCPKELFVYETSTNVFIHVAVPRNIADFPPSFDEALAVGTEYYRQAVVEVSYSAQATAIAAAEDHLRRLTYFTQSYELADFDGTEFGSIDTTDGLLVTEVTQ